MTMTSPKPGTKRSPKRNHHDDDQQRVILLLDMDCFYAQCESVRLGLDPDIPLALIQVIRVIYWALLITLNHYLSIAVVLKESTLEYLCDDVCHFHLGDDF